MPKVDPQRYAVNAPEATQVASKHKLWPVAPPPNTSVPNTKPYTNLMPPKRARPGTQTGLDGPPKGEADL